jgi:lysophospholipase L1-like esterase
MIIGDSIAVGTKVHLSKCEVVAESGINSKDYNYKFGKANTDARFVIISLGSNDYRNIRTKQELVHLRSKIVSDHVYWILPAIKPQVQEAVRQVAKDNNDTIIEIKHLQQDKVHPTAKGYKQIISEIKQ